MKKLILKLILIFLTATALSVGLDSAYRHAYDIRYQWPKNLWIYPEIADKYTLVKLGNSHAEEGITFARYNGRTISLTSAAQTFEYDLAHLKMNRRRIKEGAVILINISPISFSQRTSSREDILQTQYYSGNLSPFLIPNLKIEDYLESQIVPFYRAGFLWREKISTDIRERTSKEERELFDLRAAKPAPGPEDSVNTSELPSGADFFDQGVDQSGKKYSLVDAINYELDHPPAPPKNMLGESMNFIFNKWIHTDGFGSQYYAANRKHLENLIRYTKQQKWRPVLISIPISTVLQNGLSQDYLQANLYDNLAKTNVQGAEYIDYNKDKRITDNSFLFTDSDHLNTRGATIFSYLLLRRLIDAGYLPPESDGYDNAATLNKGTTGD